MTRLSLAKYRRKKLERGLHWTCEPGWPVHYTDAGLERVKGDYGLEEEPQQPEEQVGVVVGFPRNPLLLEMEVCGRVVLCRARRRDLYVKGMEVPMVPRLSVDGGEMYQVLGQPRRKGRWH